MIDNNSLIRGDIIGKKDSIKYYNDSCFNSSKYIGDNMVDLFFCDPPYYITKYSNKEAKECEKIAWDRQWSNEQEFYTWTEAWMSLMYKQLKNTGSAYICCSWERSGKFQELLKKSNFIIRNRITWKRDKGRGCKKNWKSMLEDIWFVTKSSNYTFNIKDIMVKKVVKAPYRNSSGKPKDWFIENNRPVRFTYPGNLWSEYTVPFWSMKEVRSYAFSKKSLNNFIKKHNTQKPKDLVKRCIIASSNIGDLIVDYFGGSGTTAIAACELNRKSIIFDKSSECIEMLKSRILNE